MVVLEEFVDFQELKEEYESSVKELTIPDDITPAGIRNLEQSMDALYHDVSADIAEIETAYKKLLRWKDLAKRSGMFVCRDDSDDYKSELIISPEYARSFDIRPKTQGEREAWANMYAASLKVQVNGETLPLIHATDVVEEMYLYLGAVLDILKEKKGRLITILSTYKLESSFVTTFDGSVKAEKTKKHWIEESDNDFV